MAFKMKKGNSPQKFLGALMGGIGGAAIGRGIRNRRASQGKTPSGLGQTMAKGGHTGFGVAPGQVMGQARRRGLVDRARTLQGFGGGGLGGFTPGFGGGFSGGGFGGLGNLARRGMGGLAGGGFFKKEESAFQKPKKKKKKGFLSKWRNRRKFLKTEKEDKNTKKESIYGSRGGYGR